MFFCVIVKMLYGPSDHDRLWFNLIMTIYGLICIFFFIFGIKVYKM